MLIIANPYGESMGHDMKSTQKESPPLATVVYVPESEVLYFENGRIREVAEEMARRVIVYFDKEDEYDAVAVRIDSAEWVLKPFVDAILVKHGITPEPEPRQRARKGHRDTVITQIRNEEWTLAPYSEAVYDTASQTLLIENGEACEVSREMAKDVHVLYGKDYDGGDWLAAVAVRIDNAETVLKPFVDAILAKHGIESHKKLPNLEQKGEAE